MTKISFVSKRLEAIASFVDDGSFVADIGSDHGWLVISLLERQKCSKAFAVENKTGPFNRLKSNIENRGLSDKIEVSLSDGIEKMPAQCDTVVLAGMGGLLIKKILEDGAGKLANVSTIIIDPHRNIVELYIYLSQIGFEMSDESFVEESSVFYRVSKWKKTGRIVNYSQDELEYGPIETHRKSDQWKAWIASMIRLNEDLIADKELPEHKRDELRSAIIKMKEMTK